MRKTHVIRTALPPSRLWRPTSLKEGGKELCCFYDGSIKKPEFLILNYELCVLHSQLAVLFYHRKLPFWQSPHFSSLKHLAFLDLGSLAQLGKAAGFTTGDEHLTLGDLIQNKILATRIQLRQHIVQ